MTEQVLAGRRALVTGAAKGLGRAYAEAFAQAGARVAVCDVDPAVEAMASAEGIAHAEVADVADPAAVKRFVDAAAAAMGGLDLVVSNAGTVKPTSPAKDSYEQALDDFHLMVDVNFRGVYLVGRAAIPHLVQAGGGDLVNIATDHIHTCGYPVVVDHADAQDCPWAGVRRAPVGGPNFDVYDASKWAIKGLTASWAQALARHAIRVNTFSMGATDTPMYRGFLGDRPPTPGMMTPEAVAAALIDLLAEGPTGRTGDSITLWAGHPTTLPPVGLDGQLLDPREPAAR